MWERMNGIYGDFKERREWNSIDKGNDKIVIKITYKTLKLKDKIGR